MMKLFILLLSLSLCTSEYIAVKLDRTISPESFSLDHDLTLINSHENTQWHVYHVEINEKRSLDRVQFTLEDDDRVVFVEHLPVKKMEKKSIVKRSFPFNDPQGGDQWHLEQIEASAAWEESTGFGVLVQVVDDGVDFSHPDLALKVNSANSWSFLSGDNVVNPTSEWNSHGTACAGLVAAVADNNNCGCGVAFDADLSGIKLLDYDELTDATFAEAMNGHIDDVFVSTNSWGSADADGMFYQSAQIFKDALKDGTQNGRDGKGVSYLWAGGNGGRADDCNRDEYSQGPYIITVTGINREYKSAYFSEVCTANFVTSPTIDLVTVSTLGECINDFSGTSGSTPIAAGVVALMFEANPQLTYRDVMHILQQSSQMVDPSNPSWTTNDAGVLHSDIYGFGVLNAKESVLLAQSWENVGNLTTFSLKQSVDTAIPDDGTVSFTMDVNATGELEHVVVWVDITHPFRLDLDIFITSPSGLQSKLISAATSTLEYTDLGLSQIFHIDGPLAEDDLTDTYSVYLLQSEAPDCLNIDTSSGDFGSIPPGGVAVWFHYEPNSTTCMQEVVDLLEDQGFVAVIIWALADDYPEFESTIPSYVLPSGDVNAYQYLSEEVTVSFTKNLIDGHEMKTHTMTSVKHWGEDSYGTWTLTVNDRRANDVGSISSWRLGLYGVLEGDLGETESTVETVETNMVETVMVETNVVDTEQDTDQNHTGLLQVSVLVIISIIYMHWF